MHGAECAWRSAVRFNQSWRQVRKVVGVEDVRGQARRWIHHELHHCGSHAAGNANPLHSVDFVVLAIWPSVVVKPFHRLGKEVSDD